MKLQLNKKIGYFDGIWKQFFTIIWVSINSLMLSLSKSKFKINKRIILLIATSMNIHYFFGESSLVL